MKHNFRQLTIWKNGIDLAKRIYDITQKISSDHKFGISSQMFRAAVSISSNIAEGSSKSTSKDFSHYLRLSLGSAFELETQLLIVKECCLYTEEDIDAVINNLQLLQKQISAFSNTLV